MPVDYTRYRTEWANLKYAYARAWSGRGNVVPPQMLDPHVLRSGAYKGGLSYKSSLELQLMLFAEDLKKSGAKFPRAMDTLARILARMDQNFSMEMSAGPRDPRQLNPKEAWKIPVRRITGAYFQNWHVRRIARGVWVVYNPTREAYYIEYGIHPSGRRVRRPIRKMALIKTLRMADRAKVGEYVWETIYGNMRESSGSRRGSLLAHFQPQSPGVMGSL